MKGNRAVCAVAERLDEAVVHRRHRLSELASHVVGLASSFGDIAFDATLESDVFGHVEIHGEVKAIGDLFEAQQEDAFDDDDRAGLDDRDLSGAGVGREVIDRRSNALAGSKRLDVGSETFVVE